MRLSILSAVAALAICTLMSGLNILLGNDDGFGSVAVREVYRLLKDNGHKILVVAPVDNESGMRGTPDFTTEGKLTKPSEFNLVPAGAPSLGQDPVDSGIWYYNGTPAAAAIIGIDWVVPHYTNWGAIDLVVAGPNFGDNLGPYLYTLSGTNGYTYTSVGKGVPGVAISTGNTEQCSYKWINQTTPSGYADPATIAAQLTVSLIEKLIQNIPSGSALLPPDYGLSVNIPPISSPKDDSCVDPPFIQSRMNRGAEWGTAVYDPKTGTFTYASVYPKAGNTCINGYCDLPGEIDVVDDGCQSSVSVFTVDYDAPKGPDQLRVRSKLFPLVEYFPNSTVNGVPQKRQKVGGFDARATHSYA